MGLYSNGAGSSFGGFSDPGTSSRPESTQELSFAHLQPFADDEQTMDVDQAQLQGLPPFLGPKKA